MHPGVACTQQTYMYELSRPLYVVLQACYEPAGMQADMAGPTDATCPLLPIHSSSTTIPMGFQAPGKLMGICISASHLTECCSKHGRIFGDGTVRVFLRPSTLEHVKCDEQ